MFKLYEDDKGGQPPAMRDDDQYLGAEIVLPIGDTMMNAKVRGRK